MSEGEKTSCYSSSCPFPNYMSIQEEEGEGNQEAAPLVGTGEAGQGPNLAWQGASTSIALGGREEEEDRRRQLAFLSSSPSFLPSTHSCSTLGRWKKRREQRRRRAVFVPISSSSSFASPVITPARLPVALKASNKEAFPLPPSPLPSSTNSSHENGISFSPSHSLSNGRGANTGSRVTTRTEKKGQGRKKENQGFGRRTNGKI